MKKISLLACMLAMSSLASIAQEKKEEKKEEVKPAASAPSFGIKFAGFVRNDLMIDSRQIVGARENELILYPADISKNATTGKDINDKASLSMNPIVSRISGLITGPDAFGAKTSGLIEFEFFGASNVSTNLARLRHAYAKLQWKKASLLAGQFWHPMFATDCFPATVAYQTVIPINPFSRNPQLRFNSNLSSKVNLTLALITQNEVNSSPGPGTGPYGSADSWQYLANNVLPELHAQLQYKTAKVIGGAFIDSKTIRPQLAYDATVSGLSYGAYLRLNGKKAVLKTQYSSVQNAFDLVMMGGYLQYGGTATTATPTTTYKSTTTSSFWAEIHGTGKKIVPGIVYAYSANQGTGTTGATASYGRAIGISGRGVKNLSKIMPRVEFLAGKFKFSLEDDITIANWGVSGTDGKVAGATDKLMNNRLLFTTQLNF